MEPKPHFPEESPDLGRETISRESTVQKARQSDQQNDSAVEALEISRSSSSSRRHHNSISKHVLNDVIHILWQSLSERLLFHTRIYNLKYFKFLYDTLFLERHKNLQNQWKVWSYALFRKNFGADPIPQSILPAPTKPGLDADRHEKSGRENQRKKWIRYFRLLMTRETKRRYNAIWCLTGFFHRVLVNLRAAKTIKTVVGFSWNASEFIRKDVRDGCAVIQRFAQKWLNRKASLFASAYCDEIFESTFVHLRPLIQSDQ